MLVIGLVNVQKHLGFPGKCWLIKRILYILNSLESLTFTRQMYAFGNIYQVNDQHLPGKLVCSEHSPKAAILSKWVPRILGKWVTALLSVKTDVWGVARRQTLAAD